MKAFAIFWIFWSIAAAVSEGWAVAAILTAIWITVLCALMASGHYGVHRELKREIRRREAIIWPELDPPSPRPVPRACTEGGPCRAADRIIVCANGNRVGSLCTRCDRRRYWLPYVTGKRS
jgi:hypothetical protein